MEQKYQYYAFISYHHSDEKWAKWLQKKLENYRLPSVIRKAQPHLPKNIRPVFRDKTDLGAGKLEQNLKSELFNSKYLIVICSPESAKSSWVGKEIKAFVEQGRTEQIIPIIVRGKHNNIEQNSECFHPVLKEMGDEILGVSVPELGRQKAFVKVAARILDLKYNMLWDRHRRRLKKQLAVLAMAGFTVLCLTGILWNNNRTIYRYYADYVDRYGLPEGRIELTSDQVKKRNHHYRFEYKKGILIRVVYANSVGIPLDVDDTEMMDRPSIQEFTYVDGRLTESTYKNKMGRLVVGKLYSGTRYDRVDFKSIYRSKETISDDATSITSPMFASGSIAFKSIVSRYAVLRDADGYITRVDFKRNDDDMPAYDVSGICGFLYTLDSLRRIVELKYIGPNGTPAPDRNGILSRTYQYDRYGNICRVEYRDECGRLADNVLMWSCCVDSADENGNICEEKEYDANYYARFGESTLTRSVLKYDDRGNVIEYSYYGKDGKFCVMRDGWAKFIAKYDDRGDVLECSYYGVDGKPCYGSEGFAKWVAKYDARGNEIECSYYGTRGQLCNFEDGYAKCIIKHDDYGNVIECSYYGVDGKPCYLAEGYAKWKEKYDHRGMVIECSYYGTEGQPCNSVDGYAKWVGKYDDRCREIESSYYGADGKPCYPYDGCAK